MQHVKIVSKHSDSIKLENLTIKEIFLSCDEERSILTIVYNEDSNDSKVLGKQCDFGITQAERLQRSFRNLISIFLSEEQNHPLDKRTFLDEVCCMLEREVNRVYG